MTITFTLPLLEEKPSSVKDMVFTLLTSKYPLSLIEIQNNLRKQYLCSASFQAIRKATLQLTEAKVFVKTGKKFSINREWILQVIKFSSNLQKEYFSRKTSDTKIEVGPNVTMYNVTNLIEMDNVWNNIMRDYFSSEHSDKTIAFESTHFWWVIAQLAQETELMKELKKEGIKTYFLCFGQTKLDKWATTFYNEIGVNCKQTDKPKNWNDGHYCGAYGDLIIQVTHPQETTKKILAFFKKYHTIGDAKVSELVSYALEKNSIQLTVIKDSVLAAKVKEGIIKEFKKSNF